jgi:hypothetical protein
MKLSLIVASSLAALVIGCGNTDEEPKTDKPADPAPTTEPAPTAPPRKLVDGKALPTSPVNLLADPAFALVGQQAGYGSFLSFYENGFRQFEMEKAFDSRSPVGFAGNIGLIKPAGATDKSSDPVLLLTSFLGGQGPFHAQIWVSKSNAAGEPVDFPTDGSAVKVSVTDGDPDRGEAFDLKPVENVIKKAGARTWVLLRADVTKPLTKGGFFVVRTGSKGGHIQLAGPEVTTDQIKIGQAVMSHASAYVAAPRALTQSERTAIVKYRSLPPKLVPATPGARFAD